MEKLNAINLKNVLWETLNNIKEGKVGFADADSIATQAREILRTVNVQLKVSTASKRNVPAEVISFSESV